MLELIKKAMFTGVGFAVLTKDKIEEVAQVFVEQGKMSEQEGIKLVEELLSRSRESQAEMTKQIEGLIQTALTKMDLAKASDLELLRAELAELKKQISPSDPA